MSLELNWKGYDPGTAGDGGIFKAVTEDGFAAFVRCGDSRSDWWDWQVWRDQMLLDENVIELTRSYSAKLAAERAIRRIREGESK